MVFTPPPHPEVPTDLHFIPNVSASQPVVLPDDLQSYALNSLLYGIGGTPADRNVPVTILNNTMGIMYTIVGVYLLFVFLAPRVLSTPWKIKPLFCVWNLLLSMFSLRGLMATAPVHYRNLRDLGYLATVCRDNTQEYGEDGNLALYWYVVFQLSKTPELLDTVFLILMNPKKPVALLQWYHHFSVLIATWVSVAWKFGPAPWFSVMNYFVHAVMYFYFAMTFFVNPKRMKYFGNFVTTIQISQMVAGFCISISVLYNYMKDTYVWQFEHPWLTVDDWRYRPCAVNNSLIVFFSLLYASYFFLFSTLFYERLTRVSKVE